MLTLDHSTEIAIIEMSRTQREFETMIREIEFMAFWRSINAGRAINGKPEIGFGEASRLWKEANK